MGNTRFFSGARSNTERGEAFKLKKWEIMKGGKLPMTNAERYKRILKKKTEEHIAKARMNPRTGFMLGGAKPVDKQMSKKAELALKEISRRKALREEKEMRQMVVVKPMRYYDSKGYFGRTDAKGNVYDETDNIVLRVDLKKGKVKTMTGWSLGKYRPKKRAHHIYWMGEWVRKYSPYHIKLRQMELHRQLAAMNGGNLGPAGMVTIHGMAAASTVDMHMLDAHGNSSEAVVQTGQRTNLGVTAWGVMSSNVHGTFGENVHGGFADNVWGRASTNIWGGIGDTGSFWGAGARPGRQIWGSGRTTQKNYIGIWGGLVAAMLGIRSRRAERIGREASATMRNARAAAGAAPGAGGRR